MSTEPSRVLFLAHVFPRRPDDPQGSFLLHLVDSLAVLGVRVDVVAPHAAGLADQERMGLAQVHRFHYAPVRWERLAYSGTMHELAARGLSGRLLFAMFNAGFVLKAVRVARAVRPQVIHAHWWLPGGFAGAVTAALTGRPLVVTTHGTDVEMLRRSRWAAPVARWVFARARLVTCGSSYLRDQLAELGVADSAKMRVIPMPVNPLFEGAVSQARDPGMILAVARLSAQKSIDTLISALGLLRERGSKAHLVVIGDGAERQNLEALAARLGLSPYVRFVGALPQTALPAYYASAAAFVLPSVREGMGLVLAEAQLCGTPVVAADSGGVTDIVAQMQTGLLFPPGDAASLAGALEAVLADPALAARLASAGRSWARERFTAGRVVGLFQQVYADAAGDR